MFIFPLIDPDWIDKYRWMSFNTRCAIGVLTIIYNFSIVMGVLLLAVCLVSYAKLSTIILVSVSFVFGLLFAFLFSIYKQYRAAHPKEDDRAVLQKKSGLIRFMH